MIAINMTDVMNALSNCIPYLVALAVVVLAVVVMIAVRKLTKPRKKLIRGESLFIRKEIHLLSPKKLSSAAAD